MDLSLGLLTQQTEHVQESLGGLNLSPNPEAADAAAGGTLVVAVVPPSASRTLPVFNSDVVSLTVGAITTGSLATGLTVRGELKLKLGGLEVTAATATCGLTVTKGAAKVNAGRGAEVFAVPDEAEEDGWNNPFDVVAAAELTDELLPDGAEAVTIAGVGNKLKLGKLDRPIGMATAWSSKAPPSSSSIASSSRRRAASRADSRAGADFLDRILPPA